MTGRVFISSIDTSLGFNLSRAISQTIVGSRREEEVVEEDIADVPLNDDGEPVEAPVRKEKPPKEFYSVTGTLSRPKQDQLPSHTTITHPTKRGLMIETGDKVKDSSRRQAIEKIPERQKPDWVQALVSV